MAECPPWIADMIGAMAARVNSGECSDAEIREIAGAVGTVGATLFYVVLPKSTHG